MNDDAVHAHPRGSWQRQAGRQWRSCSHMAHGKKERAFTVAPRHHPTGDHGGERVRLADSGY
jgi:hypothetical protein